MQCVPAGALRGAVVPQPDSSDPVYTQPQAEAWELMPVCGCRSCSRLPRGSFGFNPDCAQHYHIPGNTDSDSSSSSEGTPWYVLAVLAWERLATKMVVLSILSG